jgi:DNA mismatch repair protein MutS2
MQFDIKTLEFNKVKENLIRQASTKQGKELLRAISPTNNHLEIKRLLQETNHAHTIITQYKEPPFGGVRDMYEILERARIHSVLRPTEFLDVIGLLEATQNNVTFYRNVQEEEIEGDALTEYYDQLTPVKHLRNQIEQVISIDGRIHDNASHELSRIRAKISQKENKITERLNNIINTQKTKLADTLITIRSNRMVVPVKLSEKNNFKGSIIDYSSSGETVYMEPQSVALINNEINLLRLDEEREINRILRELTKLIASEYSPLTNNFRVLTYLDMTYAKGKYAAINECTIPEITEDEVNLVKARHPLIDKEEIVANTISMNKKECIIVITGPNTGGKTVALKTMGLISIMIQSGLMVPINEGSKTVIFENIFADIGDEQSIEQSLSTFSSHMTRIINIVKEMTVGSLILLDELGSGTDPKEGASLAIAILDYIRVRGMYVIATTHYPELKAYAYDKEEIVNASVEFDVVSLRPTYRLLIGTPGKSNALLICERLGLNEHIISKAKENVLTSNTAVSDLINKLEKQGNDLDLKIQEYEEVILKQKILVSQNERFQKDLLKQKNELKSKIAVEQSQLIQETQHKAFALLEDISKLKNRKDIKDHELAEFKYQVKQLNADKEEHSSLVGYKYSPGDLVTLLKFNRVGELVKKQKNGKWIVKMGNLSSQYTEDQFEFIEKKKEETKKVVFKSMKKKAVRGELDLRGMRYEEAKITLDKYIDDCVVTNLPYASIIHGFGTLTLRKLVKEYLSSHKQVDSHRDGEGGEGGQGVTIVYFK